MKPRKTFEEYRSKTLATLGWDDRMMTISDIPLEQREMAMKIMGDAIHKNIDITVEQFLADGRSRPPKFVDPQEFVQLEKDLMM
jgi:hypothetical protein